MLLTIQNLCVETSSGKRIVDHLNISMESKQIVALVGGSGSGKTTTGLSILQLLAPGLKVTNGSILLGDKNILEMTAPEMCRIRGRDISMVFQEPLDAFNPIFTIGYQIDEVLRYHTDMDISQRQERVEELLKVVGIEDATRIVESYPHQLSGGLRQRAMIALAIALNPSLIIADEPTSNLDVTLQARIIELFQSLRDKLGLSLLLITHDLGVVQHLTDEVYVLYRGEVVECGRTREVLSNPGHYYTKQLMDAVKV